MNQPKDNPSPGTYLVTGTSSGIGRAIALRLAERGHDVIAGVRRSADAPAHPRIRPAIMDITDAAQVAAGTTRGQCRRPGGGDPGVPAGDPGRARRPQHWPTERG